MSVRPKSRCPASDCHDRRTGLRPLLIGLAVLACARDASPPVSPFTALDSPAGANSGESHLTVDSAGVLHLTWLERLPDSSVALKYAQRAESAWSAPSTVRIGRDFFVNWADFPMHAVSGRQVTITWLQRSSAGKYSYDVWYAQSGDGGVAWRSAAKLNDDVTPSEHGFLSLLPVGGGAVQAFWLDGRESGVKPDRTPGAMQLRTRVIEANGSLGVETLVDDRNCDCCQTSVALTPAGPVLAYRDRSPDEVRDIVVRRLVRGAWSPAARVHDDNWRIEACPVNGPAIAAHGDSVAVAWYSAARDTAKVQVAFSTDGGATFGNATRVDDGAPAGRVGIVLEGGGALVTWLEHTGQENAEVRLRRVAAGGARSPAVLVAASSARRASGFPRLARYDRDVYVAWTESGDTGRVRVATARVPVP